MAFRCSLANAVAIGRISIPIVVALFAAPATGEIYKCATQRSIPTYQNFPCEFDSLGDLPNAPPAPATSATARAAGSPGAGQAPAIRQGSRTHHAPIASAPRVGMTADEVRAIWGNPLDTTKEELRKGTIETWTYADSRAIEFDRKGRVTGIKW
jgi:hypothetical protein